MNHLYPIFIKLRKKTCVIVGGGNIAFRKAQLLLNAEADIVIISPEVSDEVNDLILNNKVKFLNRSFQTSDLDGAFLMIAATDDSNVNRQVWEEANKRNVLVNVVDVPDLCNFYVPSVIRQGDLAVAISTNGKAPYLAKRLRQILTAYLQQFHLPGIIEQVDQKKQQLKYQFPDEIHKREQEIKAFIDNFFNQF